MRQFSCLTTAPAYRQIVHYVFSHAVKHELHINRIRFWMADSSELTALLLQYGDSLKPVHCHEDVVTGFRVNLRDRTVHGVSTYSTKR